jgi:hypothetical protein
MRGGKRRQPAQCAWMRATRGYGAVSMPKR